MFVSDKSFASGLRNGSGPNRLAGKVLAAVLIFTVTPLRATERISSDIEQRPISVVTAAAISSDKKPAGSEWWMECRKIPDDRARLACFDASTAELAGQSLAPDGATQRPAERQIAVQPDLPVQGGQQTDRYPRRFRFSIGTGLGIGDHAGSFTVLDGRLESNSGFGSSGNTLSVQGWLDNWLAGDWSVGLEYVRVHNAGEINLVLPNGISVLTDPVTASAHAEVEGDIGFANFVYRPEIVAPVFPFAGVGLGIGWGSAHATLKAQNAFVGTYQSFSEGESVFDALQGVAGLDFQIYQPYYLSLFGKAIWVSGQPFQLDQRYIDFIFGVSVGREF